MSDVMLERFLAKLGKATILVVDDQPINIQLIFSILADDYHVLMATSGQQALQVCRDSMPDLILMDVMMPEMDGLQTCQAIKADKDIATIPVIFVTGLQQQENEDACWQAGAVDFIQKPVNANTLLHRIKAHLTLKQQADFLHSLAYIDGLTGVFNRRYLDNSIDAQIAIGKRQQQATLSVLILDIDHFKLFNDKFGHLAGDEALRKVAKALKAMCCRPSDLVARYGGEEFMVVLPNTDEEGAAVVAIKLLEAVAELNIPHPKTEYGMVTISIGGATKTYATAVKDTLTAQADQQLYLAKQSGRNCFRQSISADKSTH
ncbi:diguanylate cyclase [Rheinheimera baltica]|uniref:diguanylate cyclase n=1 Tax=Rheinheimera baltica TaxID=67576 RepID=UPI00273FB143|nr:diguanylate cyclase [Rheinheimera baltica]MDP5142089.1 diguanylate cyclase [Rheinheimera baltica]